MKILSIILLIIAIISLLFSLVAKFIIGAPILNISASAFLRFTDTCLLFAIVFSLLVLLERKAE